MFMGILQRVGRVSKAGDRESRKKRAGRSHHPAHFNDIGRYSLILFCQRKSVDLMRQKEPVEQNYCVPSIQLTSKLFNTKDEL